MAKKNSDKKEDSKLSQEDLEAKFDLEKSKKETKKPVLFSEKKDFDLQKYKKAKVTPANYKPYSFIKMSPAFQEITGFPGFPEGFIHMIYGASDVGKTTALLEAAYYAQKDGKLPIFIITEKKFSWERAVKMGIIEDETIFEDNLSFIEEACDKINSYLEDQRAGNLPRDIVFLWDALGSTPSRAEWKAQEEHEELVRKTLEAGGDISELAKGSGGMMTANRVVREKIGRFLQHKITATRNADFPYNATLIIVNHGYISPSPTGIASLVPYCGAALKYSLAFQIRQGKVSGTPRKHTATKDGVDVTWGLEVPFIFEKNHINGISREGNVIVTPHGYILATKDSIEKYKKEHREEWSTDFEQYFEEEAEDAGELESE